LPTIARLFWRLAAVWLQSDEDLLFFAKEKSGQFSLTA
jgi:hypothetical protein